MLEWVKEHVELAATAAVSAIGAILAFVWGVRKTRADLDQLRGEFDHHMNKAEPLMQDFGVFKAEVRRDVQQLDKRFDDLKDSIERRFDDLRTDFGTLNTLLVRVLKRGFGGIREEDEPGGEA